MIENIPFLHVLTYLKVYRSSNNEAIFKLLVKNDLNHDLQSTLCEMVRINNTDCKKFLAKFMKPERGNNSNNNNG
jgi:hypothetical protein